MPLACGRIANVQTKHQNGDFSDFKCNMVADARRVGLSASETADQLRFYRHLSLGFKGMGKKVKEKISSEQLL